MVSDRSLDVLRVIVQDYIASREPVGSKTIVERHNFGVSAATIRNDMALLEEEDLIAAPHTSSGRIPTDKGYRLFVDQLSERRALSSAQRQAIEVFLGQSLDVDDVLARTVRLLAQLTHQVALVQYPSISRSRVRHVEFVPLSPRRVLTVVIVDTGAVVQRAVELPDDLGETDVGDLRAIVNSIAGGLLLTDATVALRGLEQQNTGERRAVIQAVLTTLIEQIGATRSERLLMAGAANLVRTEGDFTGSIYPILDAIEEQVVLLKLFGEMVSDQSGISVSIGRENASIGLEETAILTSGYSVAGNALARVGVLGPTRMDYSSNIAAVRAVARYLSRLLSEG